MVVYQENPDLVLFFARSEHCLHVVKNLISAALTGKSQQAGRFHTA
jgi:hypothetical protein